MENTRHITLALLKLGINPILASSQELPQAALLAELYDHVLDTLLRAHNWSFATSWNSALALVPHSTPHGYKYTYAVPSECIRIIDVRKSLASPSVDFSFIDGHICTNTENPLLRYVKRPTDTTIFPADFVAAFVTRLAAEGAPLIAQEPQLAAQLLQIYYTELAVAQTTDACTDATMQPDDMIYADLLMARV